MERFAAKKPVVVVADTDGEVFNQISAVLAPLKVLAVQAKNEEEAIVSFLEHGPALIFIDMLVPKKGGFDLAERIRRAKGGESQSIYFLSALRASTSIDKEASVKLGALGVLQKPLNDEQVRRACEKTLPAKRTNPKRGFELCNQETPASGDIEQSRLPTVLSGIINRKETCLVAFGSGKTKKMVWFKDGNLEFCSSNLISETLGRHLLNNYGLDQELYAEAIDQMIATKRRMGELLVEKGIFEEKQIESALATNVLEKVHDLFRWQQGWFRVLPYQQPPAALPSGAISGVELLWDALWEDIPDELIEKVLRPHAHRTMVMKSGRESWFEELPEGMTRRTATRWAQKFDGATLDDNVAESKKRKTLKTAFYLLLRGHMEFKDRFGTGFGKRGHAAWEDDTTEQELALGREFLFGLRSYNHFRTLGVKLDAGAEEIKAKFRTLAALYHPDSLEPDCDIELRQVITDIFAAISEANAVLSDPEARRKYREEIEVANALTSAETELAAESQFQKGVAQFRSSNWEGAVNAFREAIATNDNVADYHTYLGMALYRWGKPDAATARKEAFAVFRTAHHIDPNLAAPLYEAGRLASAMSDDEQAVSFFIRALRRAPRDKDILRQLQLIQKRASKGLGKKIEALLGG